MDDDYEMFKIVVIGSTATGKTNIATRYIRNEFNQGQKATVGVEFLSKIVQVRSQNIKVTLWDTAGQERYKSLSKVYYKGASGILIVYDVTQPQSYLDVQSWMRLANENLNLNDVVLMIVGNKIDMENQRKVSTQRAIKQYKDKFDIDCWEVSAKTGYNVREIFAELLQKIYEKNIEIKASVFHQATQYDTGSVIKAPSMVVAKKAPNARQQSIQQVKQERWQQQKIAPSNIKKQPQPTNKMTLNSTTEKKRAKQAKQKKGCC